MTDPFVSSFVVRFLLIGTDPESGDRQWRIKISHVQTNESFTVRTMDEAAAMMNSILERGLGV